MKNEIKGFFEKNHSRLAFWICLSVSIFLMVCGFFSIPIGEIHNSVLMSTGVLFAFGALGVVPDAIKEGRGVKFTKGDTSIEIEKKD